MRAHYWTGAAAFAVLLLAWGALRPRPELPPQPSAAVEGVGPAGQGVYHAPQLRGVQVRLVSKERTVRALLAGDCTLLEAAARFRELDAAGPRVVRPDPDSYPRVYVGDTEAERYCRAALFWARTTARADPHEGEAAEAAVRRLEAELEGHLACGTLELPPALGDADGGHGTPSP